MSRDSPVAYGCPCGFEGGVGRYDEESPSLWTQCEVLCCYDDPECDHPGIKCPRCGRSFDLILEDTSDHETTLIFADGARKEPRP